ncbi:zinc-binding dehydrogenase [Paraferrimonas sp. SM1919]|uniref:zinc-dependent alcohol dehydrogenase n=1 Tax=Paraferrimonas sp. SM1919 TaxID=2662263 RepID=UPI0013D64901|nr:zinc-binding dehydrogenase [Paraferrimonas sp. SM1919]
MMKNNKVLQIKKGQAEVIEKPINEPGYGFVRVRQTLAPNCIEHRIYQTGFYEFHEGECHAGHEGVGVIDAVGPGVSKWREGQRVVIFQGWACGECHVCVSGLGATHCVNLKIPTEVEAYNDSESGGNGFCEYRLVPQNMLELIPDELADKYASAANCLIGCTYSGIRDLNVGPESVCLVGGVGFIGLATIVNLKYRGATVIVLGRDKQRMQAAFDIAEADHYVNPEDEDWLEQIKALTPDGRGVDFSFDCCGYPYYQQKCLDATKHYGTLMILGYAAHEPDLKWELNTESGLSWGHKNITAHFDVNFNHRKDILKVVGDPWIQSKLDKLITHRFPMSQASAAFELLNNRTNANEFVGKVHFIPGE